MDTQQHIAIAHLCTQYKVSEQLFTSLHNNGLIQVITIQKKPCIHIESVEKVEKMIRIHQDLSVNPEGIDVIFNLMEKMERLQEELKHTKRRLHLYE